MHAEEAYGLLDEHHPETGPSLPPWQVKQVTRCWPPKYIRLRAFIITTIWRARWMRGVATANASRSSGQTAAGPA